MTIGQIIAACVVVGLCALVVFKSRAIAGRMVKGAKRQGRLGAAVSGTMSTGMVIVIAVLMAILLLAEILGIQLGS